MMVSHYSIPLQIGDLNNCLVVNSPFTDWTGGNSKAMQIKEHSYVGPILHSEGACSVLRFAWQLPPVNSVNARYGNH